MPTTSTTGLILRRTELPGRRWILSLFTAEHGRKEFIMRAPSSRARGMGGRDVGCLIRGTELQRREQMHLSTLQDIEHVSTLPLEPLDTLEIARLLYIAFPLQDPHPALLHFCDASSHLPSSRLKALFLARIVQEMGLMPPLDADTQALSWDPSGGLGTDMRGLLLSYRTQKILKGWIHLPLDSAVHIAPHSSEVSELSQHLQQVIELASQRSAFSPFSS